MRFSSQMTESAPMTELAGSTGTDDAAEGLIECVPNFSAGRDPDVLEEIVAAVECVPGSLVLDRSLDADHNRSVLTFAGTPKAVAEAAFRAVSRAAERIDLSRHAGVHPRMGATDVLPFIPLRPRDRGRAVDIAHAVGARIGSELGIPVYFYGDAARDESRRGLPDVRRGGYEALRTAIARGEERVPDAGPTDAIHPSAGATAVGVRRILIAYNVDLETTDVGVAKAIAATLRESNGGLPGIRALGLLLERRGVAQVSMNVTDYERTGLVEAFDAVVRAAAERGVRVRESELIGLAPAAALDADVAEHVLLRNFDPSKHVLEERLDRMRALENEPENKLDPTARAERTRAERTNR